MTDGSASQQQEEQRQLAERERALQENAEWKCLQRDTFERWLNEQLKTSASTSAGPVDLMRDLCDGVRFRELLEVLSGKPVAIPHAQADTRLKQLSNVTALLNFLQDEEKLRLLSIDCVDIVDGKQKVLLALVWRLIVHYSIERPSWRWATRKQLEHFSPREQLLQWVNKQLASLDESAASASVGNANGNGTGSDSSSVNSESTGGGRRGKLRAGSLQVNSLSRGFADGRALGALVYSILRVDTPESCADWEDWSSIKCLENTTRAMKAAEERLGIAQLVRPEEIAGRNADEEALLTYLAKFPVVAQSRFEERVMGVYKCSGNGALTGTSFSSGFDDP